MCVRFTDIHCLLMSFLAFITWKHVRYSAVDRVAFGIIFGSLPNKYKDKMFKRTQKSEDDQHADADGLRFFS